MKTLVRSFITIIGAILSTFSLRAQMAPDEPDLSHFSFPLFAIANARQHTGTAFFYRSADTVFLVSNYHAIKGMSPLKKTIAFDSDTIYVEYPVKNNMGKRLLSVDVSADAVGKTEIFSMVDRIDLLKVPVILPEDTDASFINELIDVAYADEQPEEVIVYGFPPGEGALRPFSSRQRMLKGRVNPNGFDEYGASIRRLYPTTSSDAISIMAGTSKYYYFIRPYAAQGYSGAPVFGKYRTAENNFVYRFAGVVFGGQPSTGQTWTIRPEVAVEYLEK